MYTVAVVTGTRAEYGLLRPVLKKLANNPELNVRLLVTGAHLSAELGSTIDEIEADEKSGVFIDAELDILSTETKKGRQGTAERMTLCFEGCAEYFSITKPDVLLLLGDRYEIFSAASAAAVLNIPVVHISGGDVTAGADDDWFRHCISQMAKLHFPSCEEYRQRVIRMGAQPSTVHNVGGLGDENIRSLHMLSKAEIENSLEFKLGKQFALVTFHPETLSKLSVEQQGRELISAMRKMPKLFYLCTKANADAGGEEINAMLEEFCKSVQNAKLVASLGAQRYLSAMKHADLVLGNSSSGVVETPSMGTPTVNIGLRQNGRTVSDNIVCCPCEKKAIISAMQKALTPKFVQVAHQVQSPYNGGDTSGKIADVLYQTLQAGVLKEPRVFYDAKECL